MTKKGGREPPFCLAWKWALRCAFSPGSFNLAWCRPQELGGKADDQDRGHV
jgi:hypothetical protein